MPPAVPQKSSEDGLRVRSRPQVGLIKEIGDAANLWPHLCPCAGFSTRDLVADVVGVGVGAACIAPYASRRPRAPSPPPEPLSTDLETQFSDLSTGEP